MNAKQKLYSEDIKFMDEYEQHIINEHKKNVQELEETIKAGLVSKNEAGEWRREINETYERDLEDNEVFYKTRLLALNTFSNESICIYRNFLNRPIFTKENMLTNVLQDREALAQQIIELYGQRNFSLAMSIRWWCKHLKSDLCYFNY